MAWRFWEISFLANTETIAMVLGIFVLTLTCASAPWVATITKNRLREISFITVFSGGVTFGLVFMHLIPEIMEDHNHQSSLVGMFFVGLTFFLLFMLDKMVISHRDCPKKSEDYESTKGDDDVLQDHNSCHSGDVVAGCHMDGINKNITIFQAYIFIAVISVHSMLEGLGFGSIQDPTRLLMCILTMALHKALESLVLGANIWKANFGSGQTTFLIIFYSLLTPLGILVGKVATSTSLSNKLVLQILKGTTGGSLLFVSVIDIFHPEFHKLDEDSDWKFATLLFGFSLTSAISFLPSSGHHHH